MGALSLFAKADNDRIKQMAETAKRSQTLVKQQKSQNVRSIKADIDAISEKVREHFKDSQAELISSAQQLHDYISAMIEVGIGAIDTETTGLDRIKDTIVGWSLYYPGGKEVYIPCKHIVPIFDSLYDSQLTYEQCGAELQRLVDAKTKLIFANADFDLAMIWRSFKVDLLPITFFDVILAWRCIKENEKDNSLKGLYTKYVMKGAIDRMKFSDFFTADLFPYCDPQVAKLYAAADAKYTYELFKWQLPYLQKDNPKCQKHKFEAISDLIFGIEVPLIKVCQTMHRYGVYLEQSVADMLKVKYYGLLDSENKKLCELVHGVMLDTKYSTSVKCPFSDYNNFNPNSVPHVQWLCYDLMKLGDGKNRATGVEVIGLFGLPVTKQIVKCRSLVTLIGTFIDKLPKLAAETPDHKIHCEFKSIGAATGRFSSREPKKAYWVLKIGLTHGRAIA